MSTQNKIPTHVYAIQHPRNDHQFMGGARYWVSKPSLYTRPQDVKMVMTTHRITECRILTFELNHISTEIKQP